MIALAEKGKGTYVLILRLEKSARIRIGKLGIFAFTPGHYAYVGSAFGPGGLGSRVGRHRKVAKPCHWHIDYLRRRCRLTAVWYLVFPVRREHDWADALIKTKGASILVPGFGSSDCDCLSHLIYFQSAPGLIVIKKKLGNLFPNDPVVQKVSG